MPTFIAYPSLDNGISLKFCAAGFHQIISQEPFDPEEKHTLNSVLVVGNHTVDPLFDYDEIMEQFPSETISALVYWDAEISGCEIGDKCVKAVESIMYDIDIHDYQVMKFINDDYERISRLLTLGDRSEPMRNDLMAEIHKLVRSQDPFLKKFNEMTHRSEYDYRCKHCGCFSRPRWVCVNNDFSKEYKKCCYCGNYSEPKDIATVIPEYREPQNSCQIL